MNFNPGKYRTTESADFEVLDAAGDIIYLDEDRTIPWTIKLASPGTKKALKAKHDLSESKKGDLVGQLKGRKSKSDEESDVRLRADFLMKITLSTNADNLEFDGKFGMDALRAIYLDPHMSHVASGAEEFHGDLGNFVAEPTATSVSA